MSAKARDGQGRWRCKTIGIRVSPEENAEIDPNSERIHAVRLWASAAASSLVG